MSEWKLSDSEPEVTCNYKCDGMMGCVVHWKKVWFDSNGFWRRRSSGYGSVGIKSNPPQCEGTCQGKCSAGGKMDTETGAPGPSGSAAKVTCDYKCKKQFCMVHWKKEWMTDSGAKASAWGSGVAGSKSNPPQCSECHKKKKCGGHDGTAPTTTKCSYYCGNGCWVGLLDEQKCIPFQVKVEKWTKIQGRFTTYPAAHSQIPAECRCSLPLTTGDCRAAITLWGYSVKENKCKVRVCCEPLASPASRHSHTVGAMETPIASVPSPTAGPCVMGSKACH
jgi:hypothetical protein